MIGLEDQRQESLRRYGLLGMAGAQSEDPSLKRLAILAQRLLRADFGAVHILDGDAQVRIAGSSGVPLDVTKRSLSMCEQIVAGSAGGDVFLTVDASQHPTFADNPWVTGELGSVRYYATAPLVGREGVPLGTLCVWSERIPPVENPSPQLLRQVADSVVAVLDARRRDAELAAGEWLVRPDASTTTLGPGEATPSGKPRSAGYVGRQWDIDAVLDKEAVQTLFQPIVHLATGSVVGFEALSRGPAGSSLEAPVALLEAAREVGRLGELDWLCRVHAMEAAAASQLHPSISWFINVEPAGLDSPCPEHLVPALARARTDLRIVLEIAEREVEGYVPHLLLAAESARNDAWGVALDDVGARGGSLALLPLLQPDVVKLDMALLRGLPDSHTAEVTAAVRAYAESKGAVVIAEGIETAAQERLARVLGATYGQGFRYGHPGPLPESAPAPRNVIPLRQRPEPLRADTPFDVVGASAPAERATKELLLHISAHLETQAKWTSSPGALLACFQDHRYFTEAKRRHFKELSTLHAMTVVVAGGLDKSAEPGFNVAPLLPTSRMRDEWVVILLSPGYAAAFIARDCGDEGPDLQRRFDFVYTHDRALVTAAARTFLQELLPLQAFDVPDPVVRTCVEPVPELARSAGRWSISRRHRR